MNKRTTRLILSNPGAHAVCCPDCDEVGTLPDGVRCFMCGGTGEAVLNLDGEAVVDDGGFAGDPEIAALLALPRARSCTESQNVCLTQAVDAVRYPGKKTRDRVLADLRKLASPLGDDIFHAEATKAGLFPFPKGTCSCGLPEADCAYARTNGRDPITQRPTYHGRL